MATSQQSPTNIGAAAGGADQSVHLSYQPELSELNPEAPGTKKPQGQPNNAPGSKSNGNSSDNTAPTRADSIGTQNRPRDSETKRIELNARVTYAEGFNKAASPRQTQQPSATNEANATKAAQAAAAQGLSAQDVKNRTIGHYIVGRSLGQGTFGKVRIGTHTITNESVAIKILEKDKIKDKGDVERVTREINILKKVRHPNVIQLYEIIETSRQLFLIMEFAPGGELFEYIVKRKRLKEEEACRFLQQIISGVEYLHDCGICHRDLKPENLLLDDLNNIKIVDFGLSNTYNVKQGQLLKTACGSPCYAAPEMIAGKKYHGLGTDIWSTGIILYAMICGYLPFEDPNTNKLYKKILSCDFSVPGFISSLGKDMIQKILQTDPAKRYTIQDVRAHDWYSKSRSVELDGIVVGKDKIPVIPDQLDILKEHFSGENLEQAATFVQNNKHNQVTSTYYLLMKKRERQTGKNYVFEQVTFEKRKTMQSTSQIQFKSQRTSKHHIVEGNQVTAGGLAHTMYSQSEQRTKGGMIAESMGNQGVVNPRRMFEYLGKGQTNGGGGSTVTNKNSQMVGHPNNDGSQSVVSGVSHNTTVMLPQTNNGTKVGGGNHHNTQLRNQSSPHGQVSPVPSPDMVSNNSTIGGKSPMMMFPASRGAVSHNPQPNRGFEMQQMRQTGYAFNSIHGSSNSTQQQAHGHHGHGSQISNRVMQNNESSRSDYVPGNQIHSNGGQNHSAMNTTGYGRVFAVQKGSPAHSGSGGGLLPATGNHYHQNQNVHMMNATQNMHTMKMQMAHQQMLANINNNKTAAAAQVAGIKGHRRPQPISTNGRAPFAGVPKVNQIRQGTTAAVAKDMMGQTSTGFGGYRLSVNTSNSRGGMDMADHHGSPLGGAVEARGHNMNQTFYNPNSSQSTTAKNNHVRRAIQINNSPNGNSFMSAQGQNVSVMENVMAGMHSTQNRFHSNPPRHQAGMMPAQAVQHSNLIHLQGPSGYVSGGSSPQANNFFSDKRPIKLPPTSHGMATTSVDSNQMKMHQTFYHRKSNN